MCIYIYIYISLIASSTAGAAVGRVLVAAAAVDLLLRGTGAK
jgi:hypothetical protein